MYDIVGILLGLALLGCILAFPIGIYLSVKSDQKEWNERKLKGEQWLADELLKPMYSIEFITIDDKVHTTGPHKPYFDSPGSRWGFKSTSKDFADRCLGGAYERGYFMDEERNSFPTCNVKSAKVVVHGQEKAS
jgi:hypothetical protein